MSNRTALGGYDVQSGSHNEPGARLVSNVIQLAGAIPSRLRPRLHGPEARMTMHSFRASPQRDANSSVLLREELRLWGLAAEKSTPHSFSSRAALKLTQIAQTVFDVAVGLFIALFILFLFASPFIAVFCLLFLSVH